MKPPISGSILIPLHSRKHLGLFALIDEADYERVSIHRWWPSVKSWTTYAYTQIDGKTVYLQRFVTNPPIDKYVDHINYDGLDNRRANLRICTNSENMRNRSNPGNMNRSGYIGVYKRGKGRWRAYLYDNGKTVYVGSFTTAEEAAVARDAAALQEYGEFASLNFPRTKHEQTGVA